MPRRGWQPVIKVRRILGVTVVTGTPHEIDRVSALSGVELKPGDKVTLLPELHHVHRNPRRKALLKYLEDQGGDINFKIGMGDTGASDA